MRTALDVADAGRHPAIGGDTGRNANVGGSKSGGDADDLELGKRRTVGLDEDAGAGTGDSGTPEGTTGGG